ncbi:hypothetical protein CAPTEDRAFT_193226 [Capitella teleta]|uniref:Uncharacterized protein n=1 Tax=Capitella teleta TaxID=283909 RepID=R7UI45_CAPTE|nr:hypothetical protein CAPTEDRAFT_193226 [Capitella teleta]|eukprot:ELU05778.1 hypothetical protein CAPTEDRAFT_193226 [Capitella teleta]
MMQTGNDRRVWKEDYWTQCWSTLTTSTHKMDTGRANRRLTLVTALLTTEAYIHEADHCTLPSDIWNFGQLRFSLYDLRGGYPTSCVTSASSDSPLLTPKKEGFFNIADKRQHNAVRLGHGLCGPVPRAFNLYDCPTVFCQHCRGTREIDGDGLTLAGD